MVNDTRRRIMCIKSHTRRRLLFGGLFSIPWENLIRMEQLSEENVIQNLVFCAKMKKSNFRVAQQKKTLILDEFNGSILNVGHWKIGFFLRLNFQQLSLLKDVSFFMFRFFFHHPCWVFNTKIVAMFLSIRYFWLIKTFWWKREG